MALQLRWHIRVSNNSFSFQHSFVKLDEQRRNSPKQVNMPRRKALHYKISGGDLKVNGDIVSQISCYACDGIDISALETLKSKEL